MFAKTYINPFGWIFCVLSKPIKERMVSISNKWLTSSSRREEAPPYKKAGPPLSQSDVFFHFYYRICKIILRVRFLVLHKIIKQTLNCFIPLHNWFLADCKVNSSLAHQFPGCRNIIKTDDQRPFCQLAKRPDVYKRQSADTGETRQHDSLNRRQNH